VISKGAKWTGFRFRVDRALAATIAEFYSCHSVPSAVLQLAPSVLPDDWGGIASARPPALGEGRGPSVVVPKTTSSTITDQVGDGLARVGEPRPDDGTRV
jgi:hypothetical protein